MKKIITCMIFGLLSLISCTEYDEIAIWNKSEYIDSRLAALEELCSRMNTNITSLQLIVEALQGNDYVTGVTPVVENGKTIGYTITFIKSGPVTIYHGKDGQAVRRPVRGPLRRRQAGGRPVPRLCQGRARRHWPGRAGMDQMVRGQRCRRSVSQQHRH